MKITDLTDGHDTTNGAFCPARIAQANTNDADVMRALSAVANRLTPLLAMLKDSHGIAFVTRPGEAEDEMAISILGVSINEGDEA